MSYGGIEFLDEPGPATGAASAGPGAAARPGSPLPIPLAAAIAGWLAAAALAAWAPFHGFFAITLGSNGSDTTRESIDGWGRIAVHVTNASVDSSHVGHAARYGIALCVCAGLLILPAVLAVLLASARAVRWERSRIAPLARVVAGLGVAAPCLLAGVIAPIALVARAQVESYRDLPGSVSAHLDLGRCLWLALVALGCALIGSAGYLAWHLSRGRLRAAPADPSGY